MTGFVCKYPEPDNCPDAFRDCVTCEHCVYDEEVYKDIRIRNINLSTICPLNGIACPIMEELPLGSRTLSVCFDNCDIREIIAEEFAL